MAGDAGELGRVSFAVEGVEATHGARSGNVAFGP